MEIHRLKNQLIAKVIARSPLLAKQFTAAYEPWQSEDTPWTPVTKALDQSTIALVTTAGVHHKDQEPFNMADRDGDPSYRVIDAKRPTSDLIITHDYYDHGDADKDVNVIFPVERLKEFEAEGFIGYAADIHYGFMGHITGEHLITLINQSAKSVAQALKNNDVDLVLLTPG
jgi:D-proline reductase (dithiol) PrdB